MISAIARVEVPAALWRKHRLGELDPADLRILLDAFEIDFYGDDAAAPRFNAVAVEGPMLERAARLLLSHPLRAHDAVQLACALAAREAAPELGAFACFDAALRDAAAAEGFVLVPPAG